MAYAGLRDLASCERALDEAQGVADLTGTVHNGGWLRFDGSRLAEERGARYVQLGRLDLAETALKRTLDSGALAKGLSIRRRGAVLADLAAIGAKRRAADSVEIVRRPDHDVTIALVFHAMTREPELLPRLLVADALPEECKELARRRTTA